MDFSKHLFRCSSLGHLMTDAQGKTNMERYNDAVAKLQELINNEPAKYNQDGKTPSKIHEKWIERCAKQGILVGELQDIRFEVELSETAKVHLSDIHTQLTTGRRTDITNKYIEKGLLVEEDGITVYSRNKKKFFKKNETHLKNLFIMGTPDIFEGASIHEATSVPDIKCSWDLYTFRRTLVKKINPMYWWQLHGYMWLTGAKNAPLAYCLINTPEPLIQAAEKSMWYKLGCPSDDDANFIDACKELRKSMVYDDLALNERLLEYVIERDETLYNQIEGKVIAGRKYLQWLDDELTKKQAA